MLWHSSIRAGLWHGPLCHHSRLDQGVVSFFRFLLLFFNSGRCLYHSSILFERIRKGEWTTTGMVMICLFILAHHSNRHARGKHCQLGKKERGHTHNKDRFPFFTREIDLLTEDIIKKLSSPKRIILHRLFLSRKCRRVHDIFISYSSNVDGRRKRALKQSSWIRTFLIRWLP